MKSTKFRLFLGLLFFLGFLFSSCGIQQKDQKNAELIQLMQEQEDLGLYGSLLLIEKDSIIFHEGYGFSNKEKSIKNGKSTIFPYGSIVKDYTQAVVFLLALESKLSLKDSLPLYFNNVPPDKQEITIGQLLKHRSGLQAYHDIDVEFRNRWPGIPGDFRPITEQEAVKSIFRQKLAFIPGTDYAYSNSGYTLLAMIIEKVSGKKFDKVVTERIFEPAGMQTTDFYRSNKWSENDVAIGYGRKSFGEINSPFHWPRNPYPLLGNGGMAGTLEDFYRGTTFLLNLEKKIAGYAELKKKYSDMDDIPEDVFGSSGGNDLGYVSVIFGLKSKEQCLIFASNNDQDGLEDVNLLRRVVQLAFDFDIATLVPGEFESDKEENQDVILARPSDSKWGSNISERFPQISNFLDLLSGGAQDEIWPFLETNTSKSYVKAQSKEKHLIQISEWMEIQPSKVIRFERTNSDLKVRLQGKDREYEFEFSLSQKGKKLIESIELLNK